MAYCPKCGVELELQRKNCPLCQFPVPQELMELHTQNPSYPEPINAQHDDAQVIRNKIFYTYAMVSIAIIIIAFSVNYVYDLPKLAQNALLYGIVIILGSNALLFLVLGFIKNIKSILLGIGITSILLAFLLNFLQGEISWALSYAFPIVFTATLFFMLASIIYLKSAHTNHFIFVPIYICLALAPLLPIIETVIQLNLYGQLSLSWSIIGTISLLSFSGVISGLYLKLPDYVKEKLIRLFHI